MATKSISQLDTQAIANETDLFEVAIVDANSASGYASKKESAAAIADAIVGEYQYPLRITGTTAKTIAGAINELKNLITLLPKFAIEVVQTLPVSDISETTLYFVPASDPEQGNYYEEYIYVNNAWELIGTTKVNLSEYYTSAQVDTLLAAKANTSSLATVATSGAYSDLSGKPTIDTALDTTSTNAVENRAVAGAIEEIESELSSPDTSDNEPYLLRDSASGTADRMVDELVGGTVAWNQLANFTDGSFTVNANTNVTKTISSGIRFVANHKYLYSWTQNQTMTSNARNGAAYNDGTLHYESEIGPNIKLTKGRYHWIFSPENSTNNGTINYWCVALDVDVTYQDFVLFDLTQMFGATIADYIYSLEQAEAGAGVAFFRKLFPADYYAYNAGELISVKATAHKMRDASDNIIGNYPLDANLELRGLFKLDANNKLYCDGDTYESSGKVTRKYGIVDLGSLNWYYVSNVSTPVFQASITNAKANNINLICIKYTPKRNFWNTAGNDKCIAFGSSALNISDSTYGTSESDFKTAMNGVYLVYELETPTTETAASFAGIQVVDGDGTEEYVDSRSVPIPVGHNTTYIHGLNEYRTAVESYLASLDARITALEGGSNTRSLSVSPVLTKSITSDSDKTEGKTEEETEETKEEAQNER